MADKLIKLKITSAVAIGGVVKRPGSVVTLSEADAKNLLHRNRAILAEAETPEDLSSLTVAELKERAAELEIEGADNLKKADLIKAIEAAEAD